MAETVSPSSGRRYGIAQVCRIWDVPRSSFYADRHRGSTATPIPPQRRGPKPAVSDDALLAAIRADLARSPWDGEGHRKVWARLRVMDGVRVAWRSAPVTTSTIQMSALPERAEKKAMVFPSGDQAGWKSPPGPFVSCRLADSRFE